MIAKKLGCLDYTYVHVYIYMYIYVHCIYMYTVYILKAALWAPTFWAVSFCHFSPWIYPSRKKNMAALVTSTLHLPQANPKNKIPYTKLNSITENRKKQKKQKTKIPEKGWGAHSCWISVFFVFFCFVFFVFFVVFGFFQAPREGCRELSLFMPQGKDAESWVLSFVFLLASQCICQNRECIKRSAKSELSQSPVLESGGLWECVFFTDVASKYHIYASDVAARSHLYDMYIYIYAYLKNFIQLGDKKQNILHMHSEKLNNAINGSMSFSQWISERKFNFALLRHAQMIGLCLLLCCRFL